ncbi:MAG: Fe-S-containing protein [Bacteroidota bacterium]
MSTSDPAERAPANEGGSKSISTTRKVGRVLIPVLLVAGGVLVWSYVNPSVHPVIREQPVVDAPRDYGPEFVTMTPVACSQEGDDLVFSLNELKKDRLIRFEYAGGKTPRAVMAYIAKDGRLVTAISVSEHCGSTEFRIKENRIYCAHCPSYWDMMTMEAFACCGKYYPDPIPSRVVGEKVHIKKEIVEQWAGRL